MIPFSKFYFEKISFDKKTLIAKFYYSFDRQEKFIEEIDFFSDFLEIRKDFRDDILDNFLFSLSIAIGISYYKLYPTKELIVETGFLSYDDILFWKKFYKNGLGEFLYRNNLNPNDYFCFINSSNNKFQKIDFKTSEKALLPIGGGKDSILSLKILEEKKLDFTPIVFGKIDSIKQNCIEILGKKEILIKRKIDVNLFKLNDKGYYNGHVPITGIIAFALLVTTYIYDYKYIVLSNEKSANVGNTNIGDLEVNHQWSKSLDFEQGLNKYIERNLSSDINYFSLLRGMYEINIAREFANKAKKYFQVFSSCNNNFRIFKEKIKELETSIWCNNCPKCAFVYAILRPFLTYDETIKIWGKELYEEKSLENLFRELLGIQGIKPFECVGEEKEVIFAMNLHLGNLKNLGLEIPYILQIFEKEIKFNYNDSYFQKLGQELFKNYYNETLIPLKFQD